MNPGFETATIRRWRGTLMMVSSVDQGSAAEWAGVSPGDIVIRWTMRGRQAGCPEARVLLKSDEAPAREVVFDVIPRAVRPPFARIDLPSGVRVLRFDAFRDDQVDWLTKEVGGLSGRGLILDLRLNAGGALTAERRVASLLVEPGVPLGESRRRGKVYPLKAGASNVRYGGPLVILIGPGTASAGETLAYALRLRGRAVLVGLETAGAVLTSLRYDLPDGGHITVPIADFVAPDGRRLEGVGVKPDIQVEQTLTAVRAGRDLPLEAAERVVLEGIVRPTPLAPS
jgi:carboxyl-terminal processing protease